MVKKSIVDSSPYYDHIASALLFFSIEAATAAAAKWPNSTMPPPLKSLALAWLLGYGP